MTLQAKQTWWASSGSAEYGVNVSLQRTAPRSLLRSLASLEGAFRITVEPSWGVLTIDLGNGLLLGAQGTVRTSGRTLIGQAAIRAFLDLDDGIAHVEARRFSQLANLCVGIDSLVGEGERPVEHLMRQKQAMRRPSTPARHRSEPCGDSADARSPDARSTSARLASAAGPAPQQEPSGDAKQATRTSGTSSPTAGKKRRWGIPAAGVCMLVAGAAGGLLAIHADGTEQGPPGFVTANHAPAPEAASADGTRRETQGAHAKGSSASPRDPSGTRDEATPHRDDRARQARELARRTRDALEEGHHREALAFAERLVELRPAVPYYHLLRGEALFKNGRPGASRRAFRRALHLDPDYQPARDRLVTLRRMAKRDKAS